MVLAYPELNFGISDDWLRYLVLRYDPGSEVMKKSADLRNHYAANLAGIEADKADRLSKGEEVRFNRALTKFMFLIDNRRWEIYVSGEMMLSQLLERVRKRINSGAMDEDKEIKAFQLQTDCYNKSISIQAEQEKLWSEITMDMSNPQIEEIKAEVRQRRSINPESFAKSAQKDENFDDD